MNAVKGKSTAIILLVALATFSVSAQVIYKIVQEDGTVLYTDQPIPGAEPLDLSEVNSAVMPRLATPPSQSSNTEQPEGESYKIEVVSPAPETTVRDNQGRIAITARLSPTANGQFHLWLNNQKVGSQTSGSFMVEGLNRGAHTFFVTATDNTGKTLASSDPQTFYMHQASALVNSGNR
ncbi:DUF4124 domain-containing protein [Alteromonas sediminis]|nr:DUF4124 domain-containing protein [Alteromonas sediminis]